MRKGSSTRKVASPRKAPKPPSLAVGGLLEELLTDYQVKKRAISSRLEEFQKCFQEGDLSIFKELCFCILAANSSAEMGMKTLAAIEDILMEADLERLQGRLSRGFRYWRIRPSYIIHTREYLKQAYGFKLQDLLRSFSDSDSRRAYFAMNKNIKGIGFKEASHFLRNIGYRHYAILDKHILKSMVELGIIRRNNHPIRPDRYCRIELRMRSFADQTGIGMDELDLLLWSRKTGKILK